MRLEDLNIGEISLYNQAVSVGSGHGVVHRLMATLALWRERSRQRAELARLNEFSRQDLGITEADVWRETRKAPWER